MNQFNNYKIKFLEKLESKQINDLPTLLLFLNCFLNAVSLTDLINVNRRSTAEELSDSSSKEEEYGFNHVCVFSVNKFNKDSSFSANKNGLRELVSSVLYIDVNIFNLLYYRIKYVPRNSRSQFLSQKLYLNSDLYLIISDQEFSI